MPNILLSLLTQKLSVASPWKTLIPDEEIHLCAICETCTSHDTMEGMNIKNELIKDNSNAVIVKVLVDRPLRRLIFRRELRVNRRHSSRLVTQGQVVKVEYIWYNEILATQHLNRYQDVVGLYVEVAEIKVKRLPFPSPQVG